MGKPPSQRGKTSLHAPGYEDVTKMKITPSGTHCTVLLCGGQRVAQCNSPGLVQRNAAGTSRGNTRFRGKQGARALKSSVRSSVCCFQRRTARRANNGFLFAKQMRCSLQWWLECPRHNEDAYHEADHRPVFETGSQSRICLRFVAFLPMIKRAKSCCVMRRDHSVSTCDLRYQRCPPTLQRTSPVMGTAYTYLHAMIQKLQRQFAQPRLENSEAPRSGI
jgi:hypothetical protein